MLHYGFVRVAAAVPRLRVADCDFNTGRIINLMQRAESEQVSILLFPELCTTGYTCADLFHQTVLQQGALAALARLTKASASQFSGLLVVGLPLLHDDQLFNCAAVLYRGKILGIVPKSYLPNYKEYYEDRWFAPASGVRSKQLRIDNNAIPFGNDLLFDASDAPGLTVGVEICEDVWVPIPPSCHQALSGATILLNLSASNDIIGKAAYRRQLVGNQSGRCMAGYVYAASGVDESTTDLVFGGHCMIAENGTILAETRRFQREEQLLVSDIDLDHLRIDRLRTGSFSDAVQYSDVKREWNRISFVSGSSTSKLGFQPSGGSSNGRKLRRTVEAHPFVPAGQEQLRERCEEIFLTQVTGLAKRLEHISKPAVAIGISGGLDSTLALVVACRAFDALGESRTKIKAITMPGFGTTSRTLQNARALMRHLGVTAMEADIRAMCQEEMKALKHKPFGIDVSGLDVEQLTRKLRDLKPDDCHDLVFENVQARMRTSILMNSGFVIGTGDVSELALGWCTYNADHMSMYNPNISIPKTLVRFLVRWAAENEFEGEAQHTLLDIVATTISPELLPTGDDGESTQATESAIGPYELHDFFLFHFLRYGSPPEKILYLAEQAKFDRAYTPVELRQWLRVFLTRFFANQFKRSCLPDGPKVGSISLSPRGDWRMPSDAQAALWLERLSKE
ncbi:MAG TPA: NAD(+) synthase [Gemmataceae bacterium]|jgi:NAD+ synthase (glutamine-hydrolysing)|nr:NAD(+) synthase [Gemmataceae bacterium]